MNSILEDLQKPLLVLRDALTKRGILPERSNRAFESIGKTIGPTMPGLSKARVKAYSNIGLPSVNLSHGVRENTAQTPSITLNKEGWRGICEMLQIRTRIKDGSKLQTPPDAYFQDLPMYISNCGNYAWVVNDKNPVQKTCEVYKLNSGNRELVKEVSGRWETAVDNAKKMGIPVPAGVETNLINVYGMAPLLTPMKIHLGYRGSPANIILGNDEGQKQMLPVTDVIYKLADMDILEKMSAPQAPSELVHLPKNQVLSIAKLLEKTTDADKLFAHTGTEISSAILSLHPEYNLAIDTQNNVWIVDRESGRGQDIQTLSNTWNKGGFSINRDGEIQLPKLPQPEIKRSFPER